MKINNLFKNTIFTFLINTIFSIYNLILGISTHSWWFLTTGVYYSVLSLNRLVVISAKDRKKKFSIKLCSGIILMLVAVPLAGMVILSSVKDRGIKYNEIVMITISLYTFVKMTLAIINLVKIKGRNSRTLVTLKNISLADAFVSVFSLQRSMVVTFEGMTENEIRIMNIFTGSAVCIIVFLLGLNLVCSKNKLKE